MQEQTNINFKINRKKFGLKINIALLCVFSPSFFTGICYDLLNFIVYPSQLHCLVFKFINFIA